MTELEKLNAGLAYCYDDPEVEALKKMTAREFEAWSRHASELRDRLRNYAPAGDLIPFEEYCEEIGL